MAALWLALAGCSGCGLQQWAANGYRVGPNYCKPPVPVASEWIDYGDERVGSEQYDLAAWWMVFNDPTLDALAQNAYQQNLSLRVAGTRILEARYRRQIAASYMFPQLQDVSGSFAALKQSGNIVFSPPALWFSNWESSFNATWELDFWGRFRRAIESADAELDASVENFDDVLVLLLAEVSTSYVDYRTFQQRLKFARQNVGAQQKSLEVAKNRRQEGASAERDVQQALTVLEQTRALVPQLEAGQRLANNRLCVLLGGPPRDLEAELGEGEIPAAPPAVAVGIPADLVRRRPDVRRAERELAAQSARIGIAQSDLYPHITLSGTFGVAAEQFGDLLDLPTSTVAGIGPAFRWDVLNYGRLLNNIRVQDARFEQLAYSYQQEVLDAGREAEDGIITFLRSQERAQRLDACVRAAQRTFEITGEQYRYGTVDYTPVYLALSEVASRQDQLASAQGDVALSLIRLYQALGGGWEIRLMGPMGGVAPMADGPTPDRADAEVVEPSTSEPEQP